VRAAEKMFRVCSGSDVAAVLREAATNTPARVDFELGEYRLTDQPPVKLPKVRDLIIDGHGAKLVLSGTLLSLTDCQRVTIQNFTVTSDRPGHTLVRIVRKGDASLVAKPEPGHDLDVAHFFDMKGTGGSFLGCMDPQHHGQYIPGAGISARNVTIASERDAFVFRPVKQAVLDLIPVGAVAVVTAYRWQWIQMNRTDECTFSNVTVTDLPGAFCGGTDNSAKSYLACKVKRRSPSDYFGGHFTTGSGRIGEWIEGCEFECLPDDGPAQQAIGTRSNEDFVYRHNRHVGGRGHGVKFNGVRAWIADNHFENLNGNAVCAGYASEVSGHGARDVIVSGNIIVRCGWTPIEARSTSHSGGNIIIRGNRIAEVRDAAVSVRGCSGVLITGNDFTSAATPAKGAWVTAEESTDIHCTGNHHSPAVPEFQSVQELTP